jgi:hypothetical protein
MAAQRTRRPKAHEHVERRLRVLGQRAGVPYGIERTVCALCRRILAERPVGRAHA